ncbi:MAG: pseudouridine synthase [Gammaproteobacteria bacterium]|nr:pseudouridine synthase [Gammaproteobacteria bacterium]
MPRKTPEPAGERLQKVLARAGFGSRRELETWIRDGRIRVNGRTADLGVRVVASDRITVDGRPVAARRLSVEAPRTIGYHKPVGEICTRNDPEGRPTIYPRLPRLHVGRWISVGRLDINSCGLLLVTTDGELAQRLMHPSRQVPREYAVRVAGQLSEEMLQRLRRGVLLDDGPAAFAEISHSGGTGLNQWYRVVLHEGRQREVRRLMESQGLTVNRLIRVAFANIPLPREQPPGSCWDLSPAEIAELYRAAGLKPPPAAS